MLVLNYRQSCTCTSLGYCVYRDPEILQQYKADQAAYLQTAEVSWARLCTYVTCLYVYMYVYMYACMCARVYLHLTCADVLGVDAAVCRARGHTNDQAEVRGLGL